MDRSRRKRNATRLVVSATGSPGSGRRTDARSRDGILLKRTNFYKVGHHGSHNATLKEHGVDQMDALKAVIIPVDEKEALKAQLEELAGS